MKTFMMIKSVFVGSILASGLAMGATVQSVSPQAPPQPPVQQQPQRVAPAAPMAPPVHNEIKVAAVQQAPVIQALESRRAAMSDSSAAAVFPSDEGMLPAKFLKNNLAALQDSGYIPVTGLKVDRDRHIWLDPNQAYGRKTDKAPVMISRDSLGYHLVLESVSHQWEAGDLDTTGLIPVKSVTAK